MRGGARARRGRRASRAPASRGRRPTAARTARLRRPAGSGGSDQRAAASVRHAGGRRRAVSAHSAGGRRRAVSGHSVGDRLAATARRADHRPAATARHADHRPAATARPGPWPPSSGPAADVPRVAIVRDGVGMGRAPDVPRAPWASAVTGRLAANRCGTRAAPAAERSLATRAHDHVHGLGWLDRGHLRRDVQRQERGAHPPRAPRDHREASASRCSSRIWTSATRASTTSRATTAAPSKRCRSTRRSRSRGCVDPDTQVVAIDEAQFLDAAIVELVTSLANRGGA